MLVYTRPTPSTAHLALAPILSHCAAREALDLVPVPSPILAAAKLELDEIIEVTATAIGLTTDQVWDCYRALPHLIGERNAKRN